ncbi:craniofacial development protein 2-like [Penaeus indicus]|uniref:craniofacial development protein 2-like n=1 Tax=Penaeus indicus TaxID=29960 RepID=UPI00300CCDA4
MRNKGPVSPHPGQHTAAGGDPLQRSKLKKEKKQTKVLTLASWNIRTLLDNTNTDRPERRTALVARELARFKVDIAALSETRLVDKGQLTETGSGYTFFWSGRNIKERRESGVGFAIKTTPVPKLPSIPEGLSDRLMKMQLPLRHKTKATLISAYAPTMTNPDEVKNRFYEEFDCLISSVPQSEKLLVLGDVNARVGTDHQAWNNIIGKHGIGKCNSNGLLLLRRCAKHDLAITNTMFRLPTHNKTSWMHPRSRHWHLIDYIITRVRDRQDVRLTKAMCGAECWTEHRLTKARLKFIVQPKRRPQGADEIQGYADRHDIKRFYDALKAVYGPQSTGSSPLLSADGSTLLTDKKQILQRWAEHFHSMLNRLVGTNDEAVARLPQLATNQELDTPPTQEEVNKAIKQMTSGKAPGPDTILAEVFKMDGESIRNELTSLFQTMWNKQLLPQEFRDATIVHIYKRKGSLQSCDNHIAPVHSWQDPGVHPPQSLAGTLGARHCSSSSPFPWSCPSSTMQSCQLPYVTFWWPPLFKRCFRGSKIPSYTLIL